MQRQISLDISGNPILESGDIIEDFDQNKYRVIPEIYGCQGCQFLCKIAKNFNCEASHVILVKEEIDE